MVEDLEVWLNSLLADYFPLILFLIVINFFFLDFQGADFIGRLRPTGNRTEGANQRIALMAASRQSVLRTERRRRRTLPKVALSGTRRPRLPVGHLALGSRMKSGDATGEISIRYTREANHLHHLLQTGLIGK